MNGVRLAGPRFRWPPALRLTHGAPQWGACTLCLRAAARLLGWQATASGRGGRRKGRIAQGRHRLTHMPPLRQEPHPFTPLTHCGRVHFNRTGKADASEEVSSQAKMSCRGG